MLKFVAFTFCTVAAVRDKPQADLSRLESLPCTLTVEHGQAKKQGEDEANDSFQIMLKCSEAVKDGRLMVPWLFKEGSFPLNIKGSDGTDVIKADESIKVWGAQTEKVNEYYGISYDKKNEKTLSYVGSTFKFTAQYGEEDTTDEVSVVISEAPKIVPVAPTEPSSMTGGDLPCELTIGDFTDTTAAIKMTCTQEVTEVRLITPPSFNNVKFSQAMAPGKAWTLMTLQRTPELEGQTFVVEAISSLKSEAAKSNVVTFPGVGGDKGPQEVTVALGGLPCVLKSAEAKLQSKQPGFSITMSCDQKITDVHLKIPGFADRVFNELTPGKEWVLATYPKQDALAEKAFFVEATYEGEQGKSNEVFQP